MPRMRSRVTPPPIAVTTPRIMTPKISMFFFSPVIAPETENATVPMISNAKMRMSITHSENKKSTPSEKMVYSVFLPERFSASRIASSVQMPFQRTVPVRFFYLRVSPLRWPEIRLSPKPVNRIPDYFIAHSGTCQEEK